MTRVIRNAVGILCLFVAVSSHAAKRARVEADSVEVLRSLSPQSGVIEVLPRNTPLVVGNQPVRGYYKVRTPSGNIGWIYGGGLRVIEAQQPYAEAPVREEDRQPIRAGRERSFGKRWFVRALGGIALYNSTDLNTQIGGEVMASGFAFGAEIGYRLSPSFGLLIRGEYLLDSASILQTNLSDKAYDLSISSLPIMGGFAWQFVDKPKFSLHLNVLGGLGIGTSVSAIATEDASPNETILSGSAIALLGSLNATYKASPTMGIFLEAGYRYLVASTTTVETAGNGDQLFRTGLSAGGQYVPLAIDMSGITFHGGAVFYF